MTVDRHLCVYGSAGALAVFLLLVVAARFSPYPELAATRRAEHSPILTDIHDRAFAISPTEDGVYRVPVDAETLPQHVVGAFVIAEDVRYFVHPGIDPVAVVMRFVRAATRKSATVTAGGRAGHGGATISVQLARMIREREESRPSRKTEIADLWNALRLRARTSSNELLSLWLTHLPFGFQTEGVEAAARRFYGKSPSVLSPAEAIALAVMPRNPTLYAVHRYPERVAARSGPILTDSRFRVGSYDVLEAARRAHDRADELGIRAAYLPDGSGFGLTSGHIEAAVLEDPWFGVLADSRQRPGVVATTIDLDIQRVLERNVSATLQGRETSRISDVAALVVDTSTGAVRAYLGARPNGERFGASFIDASRVARSPGSTLKPFLYALALERGYRPETLLPDEPTRFGDQYAYLPRNFDNRFRGLVRLDESLASSLNIPAVVLHEELGGIDFLEYMERNGFESLQRFGPESGAAIVLGAAPVTLREIVQGYATIARGGVFRPLTLDRYGLSRQSLPEASIRVIDESVSREITRILSDASLRRAGFPDGSTMDQLPGALFKTGTANQYRDIVAVAADGEFTVGVWMGNLDGSTIIGRPGSSLPAGVVADTLRTLSPESTRHGARSSDATKVVATDGGEGWTASVITAVNEAPSARITHPADGAVFYFDPRRSAESQRIEVVVVSRDEVVLERNGEVLVSGGSGTHRIPIKIERGAYTLRARSDSSRHTVRFRVE